MSDTARIDEFDQRRRSLAQALTPLKIDALLVSFLANVRYLTGYTGSNGLLLLYSSGEATFFTDPRYRISAAVEVSSSQSQLRTHSAGCSGVDRPQEVSADRL